MTITDAESTTNVVKTFDVAASPHFQSNSVSLAFIPSSAPFLLPPAFPAAQSLYSSVFSLLTRWLHEEGGMAAGKQWRGGKRRRRAEPKQGEITVCLVRAAYYLEHSNLPPLG